jgi:serine/threonine-protein kinase
LTLPARYTPIEAPKKGGYGQVVRCHDSLLDREVVIKKILHPAHLSRIIDEVVALQEAKSKHVVEVYDVLIDSTGADISIVEEYLPGEDLSGFKFDPSNEESFYKVAFQIAKALDDIHSRDVVHRDIKPNNMKFDAERYIRIFDFGLAKSGTLPTSTVSLTGTPGFMAPEQFVVPPIIDKPVDIYAFGVLLFVFVTGGLPHCAMPWPQSPVALPSTGSIANFGITDASVAAMIDRCLELNPNARPSASELRLTFERRLLYGKHKAILVSASQILELDTIGKPVKATHGVNSVVLTYDGYDFIVSSITGDVFINNNQAVVGARLVGAHVLTLGLATPRYFITFDVSHPEVAI